MRTLLMAGCGVAALAAMAADTGSGTGGADPVASSDPTPTPIPAEQVAPAEPAADPAPAAVGPAPGEDPNPPSSRKGASKKGKRTIVVWVQPGHETFGIGQVLAMPGDEAAALRAVGRLRYASAAEVKAAGDDIPEVDHV